MLKQIWQKQTNIYSPLYDRIDEKHFTKRINSAISLEFVKEMMAKRYSLTMGRTAKDPEMMLCILLLRSLLDTSDGGILAQID
jgi:hypothetical protein